MEDGLDWIVRHQRADGSWSLNFQEQCQASPCPAQRAIEPTPRRPDWPLLPLFGAGYIHTVKSRHQDAVRRGLDWLVAHQQPDGDLFIGPPGMAYLYSHAIGTMAICEAYGLSGDPTLKRPAQRAIQFIVNAQDPVGGGWRYSPGQLGDTSVFGWQMFALRSGHLAGIKIPAQGPQGLFALPRSGRRPKTGDSTAYQPGRGADSDDDGRSASEPATSRLAARFPALVKGVGADRGSDLQIIGASGTSTTGTTRPSSCTTCRTNSGSAGISRSAKALISTQVKDSGCAQGSWDPFSPSPDRYGRASRPALLDVALDPDSRGLLPVSAALSLV